MIYTSYFAQIGNLLKHNIEPIAISRGAPKNFTGRRIFELAPTWAMLKMSDEDYNRSYEQILARNDPAKLVESFGGKDVALLCWEKDINDCHRKRVGEWLREAGYEVEEFNADAEEEHATNAGPDTKRLEKAREAMQKRINERLAEIEAQKYEQLSFI